MAAKPTFPGFKPLPRPKRAHPRKPQLERQLADAINGGFSVLLRYDDDRAERSYLPTVLFYADAMRSRVDVLGTQIHNPAEPWERGEPRRLEVGKIRTLIVSADKPPIDRRFDRFDPTYKHGIICPR